MPRWFFDKYKWKHQYVCVCLSCRLHSGPPWDRRMQAMWRRQIWSCAWPGCVYTLCYRAVLWRRSGSLWMWYRIHRRPESTTVRSVWSWYIQTWPPHDPWRESFGQLAHVILGGSPLKLTWWFNLTSCHLSNDLKRGRRRGWQVNLTSANCQVPLVKFHLCPKHKCRVLHDSWLVAGCSLF